MTRVLAFIAVGIAALALIVALNVSYTPPAEPSSVPTFSPVATQDPLDCAVDIVVCPDELETP